MNDKKLRLFGFIEGQKSSQGGVGGGFLVSIALSSCLGSKRGGGGGGHNGGTFLLSLYHLEQFYGVICRGGKINHFGFMDGFIHRNLTPASCCPDNIYFPNINLSM